MKKKINYRKAQRTALALVVTRYRLAKAIVMLFLFSMCIFSCFKQEQTSILVETKLENDETIYILKRDDEIVAEIGISSAGKLDYVMNPVEGDVKQVIFYYPSTGRTQSKVNQDYNRTQTGLGYYFYEGSGNLASVYEYVDGSRFGEAFSYHDSINMLKSIMLYDHEGKMYYRKKFDEFGNHVLTEGSKSPND